MTAKEIKTVLEKHKLWLKDEPEGERASFEGADLKEADLRGAHLSWADLRGAHLSWADLRGANLKEADLRWADLRGANLKGADLRWANLRGADLERANLKEADLSWADLRWANLREADLERANLKEADLDHSCIPLWCRSLTAQFDDRQLKQIAYHFVKAGLNSMNASDETKAELSKLIDFANGSHLIEMCGIIKKEEFKNEYEV